MRKFLGNRFQHREAPHELFARRTENQIATHLCQGPAINPFRSQAGRRQLPRDHQQQSVSLSALFLLVRKEEHKQSEWQPIQLISLRYLMRRWGESPIAPGESGYRTLRIGPISLVRFLRLPVWSPQQIATAYNRVAVFHKLSQARREE